MTLDTTDSIAAMRRAHGDLVAVVEGLDADALASRSGSAEWTVADVLSHLGSAAEIGVSTLARGSMDMAVASPIWDRWNAMSAAEQAAGYVTAGERMVAAFEAFDDEALQTTRLDLGFLPAPVDLGFFARMRHSEVGLHIWDIAVAFGDDAAVPDYLVPFVLELLPAFAPMFAKPDGRTASIAVETTDPAHSYVLELTGDGAGLREEPADRSGTQLTLPAEAFLRLTSGRLAPAHTPTSVAVEGDLSLAELRTVFPGY